MMFFQKDPTFTIIIIIAGVGVYLFFKARKSKSGLLGFLSGKADPQENKIDDLITLMVLNQLFNNSNHPSQEPVKDQRKERQEEIDKVKREVLDLLESD